MVLTIYLCVFSWAECFGGSTVAQVMGEARAQGVRVAQGLV